MSEVEETPYVEDSFIADNAEGLTFIDIGGLYGTVREKASVAHRHKAKSVTMMDIAPADSYLWNDFHARMAGKGLQDVYQSVSANLDDPDLVSKIGTFDFVHCSGIIYHAPSPFHTLMQLRSLTKKYLLLGSMTVPTLIQNEKGTIDMSDGAAYFIPALSGQRFEIFKSHFSSRNYWVHNINSPDEHPWMFGLGEPNYAPWWWLWSADTLKRMAETAGFKCHSVVEQWEERAHYCFLEAV